MIFALEGKASHSLNIIQTSGLVKHTHTVIVVIVTKIVRQRAIYQEILKRSDESPEFLIRMITFDIVMMVVAL